MPYLLYFAIYGFTNIPVKDLEECLRPTSYSIAGPFSSFVQVLSSKELKAKAITYYGLNLDFVTKQ